MGLKYSEFYCYKTVCSFFHSAVFVRPMFLALLLCYFSLPNSKHPTRFASIICKQPPTTTNVVR